MLDANPFVVGVFGLACSVGLLLLGGDLSKSGRRSCLIGLAISAVEIGLSFWLAV